MVLAGVAAVSSGSIAVMSEPADATVAGFQVSAASFTPATTYAHDIGRWTVTFTTSSTGALIGNNVDALAILFPSTFSIPSTPSAVLLAGFTGTCSSPLTFAISGELQIDLQPGCNVAASTAVTLVVKGITNPAAGTYQAKQFRVSTTQDRFLVAGTSPITLIPQTAPSVPISVAAAPLTGRAHVTWNQPRSDGGSDVTTYTAVARNSSNAVAGRCISVGASPDINACTIQGLTSGVTYAVRVKATNAIGSSAASSGVTVTPL